MSSFDFHSVFLALASPHMVLDRDLVFVAANPAYEKAVMRTSDELVGRGLFDLFPDDVESGASLRASLKRVLETGEPDAIAFLPYRIPRPPEGGGGSDLRYWTASHTPLKDAAGRITHIVQNTVEVTELVKLKEAASQPFQAVPGEAALLERAIEAEQAYRQSLVQSADFRRLFRQAPDLIAVLEGEDHRFAFVNDSYMRFVGERELIGRSVREAMPEIEGQGFLEILDEVYLSGRAHVGESVRVLLQRVPGEPREEAFLDFSYHPVRDASGRISGVFAQATDRTSSVRAAEDQRLLIDELNHRVKNTLATVQSIARQSFRHRDGDQARARGRFESRILALSRAHNVLSERQWRAAALTTLLEKELCADGEGRVRLCGPKIDLNSKAAVALALVFHELANNAACHGSLAGEDGRLTVEWSLGGEHGAQLLEVSWREQGGECRQGLLRPGFGLKLMQRIIEKEFGGDLDLDLADNGLICGFRIAMTEVETLAS